MRIHLNEIPEEGQEWILNRKTGELNEVLSDLVGQRLFECQFRIRPLELPTYEIKGRVVTSTPESCSRCGDDFQWQIDEKFCELLIPKVTQPRNSHFAKPNHFSDTAQGEVSTAEYEGQAFEAGEYIHEIIALSIPTIPAPPETLEGKCSTCGVNVKECTFGYQDKPIEKISPFASLESLKKQ